MDVKEAIQKRRAYRSLDLVEITKDLITDLAGCAQLSASCNNNQSWRFVFVYEQEMLVKMYEVLSKGNAWAKSASMIIAVLSRKDYDCIIDDRDYFHFDTGMATAFLILRATELGLVAHPIAGYSPQKTRDVLGIPDDIEVITLVIVGKHAKTLNPVLSEKQISSEKERPERFPFEKFVFLNRYQNKS
jgi:nitroreductase